MKKCVLKRNEDGFSLSPVEYRVILPNGQRFKKINHHSGGNPNRTRYPGECVDKLISSDGRTHNPKVKIWCKKMCVFLYPQQEKKTLAEGKSAQRWDASNVLDCIVSGAHFGVILKQLFFLIRKKNYVQPLSVFPTGTGRILFFFVDDLIVNEYTWNGDKLYKIIVMAAGRMVAC
jgi:hypothetical protein